MEPHSYMSELVFDNWLHQLEAMSPSKSGVLFFEREAEVVGSVLFERGRVCWAVGTNRTLAPFLERVAIRSKLSSTALRSILEHCRSDHRPIWDTLLAIDAISDSILRDAIREHCADVLLQIESLRPTRRHWMDRAALGSRYGIPLLELISDLAGKRIPSAIEKIDQNLETLSDRGIWSVAFVDGLPRCHKRVKASWLELVELQRWAEGLLDTADRFADRNAIVVQADDGFIVIAQRGRTVYVTMGEPQQLGRILNALPDESDLEPLADEAASAGPEPILSLPPLH